MKRADLQMGASRPDRTSVLAGSQFAITFNP